MVDDITDIYINENLDFELGVDNDLKTTPYEDTPLQSVFIHIKNAVRPYIGRRITRETLYSLGQAVSNEVRDVDPQISSVEDTTVTYDENQGEVTVDVTFDFNDEFQTVSVTESVN